MSAKDRILVNIDKGGTYIKEIMPIIKECGMEKQVIIKGYYPVEKVKKNMVPMKVYFICLLLIYGIKKLATIQTFIKDFTPVAYELCLKDDTTPSLRIIDEIIKSGSRIWMNTLWDSLCGGHDDENALLEGKDRHWGWMLKHKATMIQTDRPQELIHYLEEKGLRNLQ